MNKNKNNMSNGNNVKQYKFNGVSRNSCIEFTKGKTLFFKEEIDAFDTHMNPTDISIDWFTDGTGVAIAITVKTGDAVYYTVSK